MNQTFIGIDWGQRRIGLAVGETDTGLAFPAEAAVAPSETQRMEQIAKLINQRRPTALVVGYPLNMDGTRGPMVDQVDVFIQQLEARFGLPVFRVDERLSSSTASGMMDSATLRKKRRPRDVIRQRHSGKLDSRAAAVILQDFLDQPKASGEA